MAFNLVWYSARAFIARIHFAPFSGMGIQLNHS